MVKKDLAIATTTWYNPDSKADVNRMDLAERSVWDSLDLGYDIVVVDGGSPDEFLKRLEIYGAHVLDQKEKGMGKGRREALKKASELSDTVVWTEPEKHTLISHLDDLSKPVREGDMDLIIPTRHSLDSYPTFQKYAEKMGNQYWKDLTKTDLDMWIGVRIMNDKALQHFLSYDGKYGDTWDSIHIPVMDVLKSGCRVAAKEFHYEHPPEQKGDEENDPEFHKKRLAQLDNLISAFDSHWKTYK